MKALRVNSNEECWVLVGERRGRIWHARRLSYTTGQRTSVAFDHSWVMEREEKGGDVVGFLHTHPGMTATPSSRDLRTMRGWCSAFGKPLLCVIVGSDGMAAYRFEGEGYERLAAVEWFPRGVIIGVESHGRQVPSRGDVSVGAGGREARGAAPGALRRRCGRVQPRG